MLNNISKKLEEKQYIYQFSPTMLMNIIGSNKKIFYRNKSLKSNYLIDITHSMLLKYYCYGRLSFSLNAKILRSRYGTYYNYYIDYLVENKIIYLKYNYSVGRNSKIYKINPDILNGDNVLKYKNHDHFLLKKYKTSIMEKNSSYINKNVQEKIVNDLFYIDIDYDLAYKFLNTLKGKSYKRNLYVVEAIQNKHIFYHFDDYGRIHTNFTVLKNLIRKNCLTIDGEQLIELDIKNSQPLFLTSIIEQYSLEEIDIDTDEYDRFKELTIDGNLYDYFIEELNLSSKKMAKMLIYKVLFGKNFEDEQNKKFKKLFPTIHNFIVSYKKISGDYKTMAYILQRKESNLVFNMIIQEIIEKYPYIKLFTIHDSISFPIKYKKEISEIFYDKLKEFFSFSENNIVI
jgi:hypothetical protein